MIKITLIGAGSVVFAKNLLGDILQFPALADSQFCLMDIDPRRLRAAEVMAKRMVAKLGTNAKIVATADRREAIRNANYVICTIQVGGYKPGTLIDFEIPKKYGLQQTIGDTLGVGGIFRALRTIPAMLEIARDIADIGAPNCLLLNYTNPMAMNCMAVDRAVGIPHVGLCHSVQGTSRQLASYAGLPYSHVSYLVAGVNHMAFFLKFEYKGQDAYPLLFKAMDNPQTFGLNKVRFEMMRRLGYFVTESSEHQAEYNPYFIHHGQEIIETFDIPVDEYLRRCEAITATWEETERQLLGEGGEIEIRPRTHEYGSYIINSRETDSPTVVYGNVPNNNLITNLPHGCCVEVPCVVDRNGVQPTRVGDLPTQLAAICRSNVNVQELAVEAALDGRREAIYHAAMMDPHTAASLPLDRIWALCDDLIEAHQNAGLLPEFSRVMANTGRAFTGTGDRVIATLELDGPLNTEVNDRNNLNLVVENPTPEKIELTFNISPRATVEFIDCGRRVKISVPPYANKTASITFTNLKEISEAFEIELTTEAPNALCRGAHISPRPVAVATKEQLLPFHIELDGNPAVAGSIQRIESGFRFRAKVSDSHITPSKPTRVGWTGSRIELRVARDDKSPVVTVYLIPSSDSGHPLAVDCNLKTMQTISLSQSVTEMCYEIEAILDFAVLGLRPDDTTFLFDIACGLGALGDAHSGGLCSLSGNLSDNPDSSSFHLASFEPLSNPN